METKEFNLGDVLSITTGYLVSSRYIIGVEDILNFMTGDQLFTHQLPRASRECEPFLRAQFPQLTTPEMDFEVATLSEMLKTPSGKADKEKLVAGWLAKQAAKYGDKFAVKPLPKNAHQFKDPMDEMVEMKSKRK